MKTILSVFKKELYRVFHDRRLVAALFLPGILIFIIYSLLGGFIGKMVVPEENHVYSVYTVGTLPNEMQFKMDDLVTAGIITLTEIDEEEKDEYIEKVNDEESGVDVVVEYGTMAFTEGGVLEPTYMLYYSSMEANSQMASSMIAGIMYDTLMPTKVVEFDQIQEDDATVMLLSTVAPMLLMVFLFAGCISVAPESIAGEKERGTLGLMLVTPVKRGNIAIGKILALSLVALISGAVSFAGLVGSLPKLLEGSGMNLTVSAYGFKEYAVMFVLILSAVFLITGLISVVSAYSKSVKEATAMVSPIMLVVVVLGMSTMFTGANAGSVALYFIPLYNIVRLLHSVFMLQVSMGAVLVTFLSNIAYSIGLIVLLKVMFDSEKIMFRK